METQDLPVPELTPFGIKAPKGLCRIPMELIAFVQRREFERNFKGGKYGKGNKIVQKGRPQMPTKVLEALRPPAAVKPSIPPPAHRKGAE